MKALIILPLLLLPTLAFRLPQTFVPENYRLKVITHLNEDNQGFRFSGKVWILINCIQDTNNITLHSKNLTIIDEKVKVKFNHEKLDNVTVKFDEENDFLSVFTSQNFFKGNKYLLYIPFEASLSNTSLHGYYLSSYFDKTVNKRKFLSVTQFEPISARLAFPCFDEPELKATFDVSLGHHKDFIALSNMPIESSSDLEGYTDFVIDTFQTTVPMSTYLVAYTINDFEYKEAKKDESNISFRVYARRDAIDQVEYAKNIGPKVIKHFEEYFDIKYPLPKMDMIAIPDFSAGAMENWGLITYRETALLYAPNVSSSSNQHRVASVVAHELAHQWFGNLVTMKWWTDLWLNEGFATYVASLGVEHIEPDWNSFSEESVDNVQDIFRFDALKSSHPVSVPIGHPNQISQIFDAISYNKGSCIIRMMHSFLGEETFRKGVSNYLKLHKYKNADQNDLWKSLTDEAHKQKSLPESLSVEQIMDTWTKKVGYPIIKVERDYSNNTASISQQKFLLDLYRTRDQVEDCWYVPLTYTTKLEKNFTLTSARDWLECECNAKKSNQKVIENLPSDKNWVIFNLKMTGLYKVDYDEQNWQLLIDALKADNFDHIETINRAQLVNDVLDLAWTGQQDYDKALSLAQYLKNEQEYIPWKAALSGFSNINRILRKTPIYQMFRNYLKSILSPIYQRVGGLDAPPSGNRSAEKIKLKAMIASWSCSFEVDDCVPRATEYFHKWMNQSEMSTDNPVPSDLRRIVYCYAIKHGGEAEWNFLWKVYLKSNVASEKAMIIRALLCSKQSWILIRYLDWSLNATTGLRKQDAISVFSAVAHNEIGTDLAKSFLIDKIQDIFTYFLPESQKLSRYVKSLAENMSTQRDMTELEKLINDHMSIFKSSSQGIKQALEIIELNNQWRQNHYQRAARSFTANTLPDMLRTD